MMDSEMILLRGTLLRENLLSYLCGLFFRFFYDLLRGLLSLLTRECLECLNICGNRRHKSLIGIFQSPANENVETNGLWYRNSCGITHLLDVFSHVCVKEYDDFVVTVTSVYSSLYNIIEVDVCCRLLYIYYHVVMHDEVI